MVGDGFPVCDTILGEESGELAIAEMRASVTNDCSGSAMAREDVVLEEVEHHFAIVCWRCLCFDPPCHVVDRKKNVFVAVRGWEGSHEVDPHTSNGSISTTFFNGISSRFVMFPVLWNLSHDSTNFRLSRIRLCQKKPH